MQCYDVADCNLNFPPFPPSCYGLLRMETPTARLQAAKLQWLQNCALAVDPSEPKIRTHLPLVLGQLKSALLSATPTIAARGGPDVNMVRLTTHVVNSLGLTSSTMPSAASNTSGPGSGAAAGGGGGGIGGSGGSGGMGGQ